jgi:hypothetical protein
MGNVRNFPGNLETNFVLADAARREFFATNGHYLVLRPVEHMDSGVDAGDRHHSSRFVNATFASLWRRHK